MVSDMKSVVTCITKLFITTSVTLSLLTFTLGCGQDEDHEITFQQLFSNPDQYNGKEITVDGFFFQGFEVQAIAKNLEYSGHAEGHLVLKGEMIWVKGGIPREVYDELYSQSMMGPEERYGKVRVTGMFEYGGKYGHLSAYDYQILPSKVELMEWSQKDLAH